MPNYRIGPAAARDLADIWRYTDREWGREQANRYVLVIKAMCAELAEAPLQAPSCAHIRPGYRRRSIGQHVIYFKQMRYGIAIIRILHHRMDLSRRL